MNDNSALSNEELRSLQLSGSMQSVLSQNIGEYVGCEFLIGTNSTTTKYGFLYSVAQSYLVLFEDITETYVVCDIYSIKFVSFYKADRRP